MIVYPQYAFTVDEFCETHRIPKNLFKKLDEEGLSPKSFWAGKRRLISVEAAREWREAMWQKFPASRGFPIEHVEGIAL
jgi:hypothetical protein